MSALKSSSIATTLATAIALGVSTWMSSGTKSEAKSEVVEKLRPVVDAHAREIESLRADIYRLRREDRDLQERISMIIRIARANWNGAPHHRPATLSPAPLVLEDEGPPLPSARLR